MEASRWSLVCEHAHGGAARGDSDSDPTRRPAAGRAGSFTRVAAWLSTGVRTKHARASKPELAQILACGRTWLKLAGQVSRCQHGALPARGKGRTGRLAGGRTIRAAATRLPYCARAGVEEAAPPRRRGLLTRTPTESPGEPPRYQGA